MARKPTDKQLFKMKNEWLGQFYEEVKPKDFYRAVFPEGSFEREGHPEDEKCNGVLTVIEGEKARNYIVFDELNMVDEVKGAEFAIMSSVGYSGRNRTAKNARWLYGIAVDLDGVEMEQLRDVFHQMKHDFLPQCTYCVNSGHIASEKEDLESYKADLEEALEELKDMREDWKPEKEPNMDEEIELIKKWVKEREDFINE